MTNANKIWWWEKTIEYMFVRHIMSDSSIAAPLDGSHEKWWGDTMEKVENKFRLIEFKKTSDASGENKKYGKDCTDYINACESIANKDSVSHWLVFGEENSGELKLKYRQYFQNASIENNKQLTKSSDMSTMEFKVFQKYIEDLMRLRGKQEGGSSGGLVLAGVDNNQVTALSLEEFLHVVPSLDNNFQASHDRSRKHSM